MNKKKNNSTGKLIGIIVAIAIVILVCCFVMANYIIVEQCAPPDCSKVDEETCRLMGCRQLTLLDKILGK